MSCLILAISGIGLIALDHQRGEADRSTLVVEPAYDANRQVGTTMVEAQRGIRGYIAYQPRRPAGADGGRAGARCLPRRRATHRRRAGPAVRIARLAGIRTRREPPRRPLRRRAASARGDRPLVGLRPADPGRSERHHGRAGEGPDSVRTGHGRQPAAVRDHRAGAQRPAHRIAPGRRAGQPGRGRGDGARARAGRGHGLAHDQRADQAAAAAARHRAPAAARRPHGLGADRHRRRRGARVGRRRQRSPPHTTSSPTGRTPRWGCCAPRHG